MHNVDPESFLAKNRAGAVMSYWTRIYKKTLEHVLFLPEAASSFAEILYKYILESKATTPNSSCCLLHSVPNWMRSPGAQRHGYMLSVLSFSLHRVGKDVSLTCLNCLWSGCTMTTAASAAGAGACAPCCPFSKDSRHWFGLTISDTQPNIPFATMLITPPPVTPDLKTKGVPATPGHWEDAHPADKFHQRPL